MNSLIDRQIYELSELKTYIPYSEFEKLSDEEKERIINAWKSYTENDLSGIVEFDKWLDMSDDERLDIINEFSDLPIDE